MRVGRDVRQTSGGPRKEGTRVDASIGIRLIATFDRSIFLATSIY